MDKLTSKEKVLIMAEKIFAEKGYQVFSKYVSFNILLRNIARYFAERKQHNIFVELDFGTDSFYFSNFHYQH